MKRTNLARTWFVVVVLAAVGLAGGILAANVLVGRGGERYTAHATLAMLPAPEVPAEQVSAFWEVLSRGQATRSAAVVLEDGRWLKAAAGAAGLPAADLELTAGVILDTTLIEIRMTASSAQGAETALDSVLADAVGLAATVSGPYTLKSVASPEGSAQAIGPAPVQVRGGLALGGLLAGAVLGALIARFTLQRRASGEPGVGETPAATYSDGVEPPVYVDDRSSPVEVPSQ